jgi:hypothetical protein
VTGHKESTGRILLAMCQSEHPFIGSELASVNSGTVAKYAIRKWMNSGRQKFWVYLDKNGQKFLSRMSYKTRVRKYLRHEVIIDRTVAMKDVSSKRDQEITKGIITKMKQPRLFCVSMRF